MAKRKILVVDDEKYVVELIRDILESGGYKVIPAYNVIAGGKVQDSET